VSFSPRLVLVTCSGREEAFHLASAILQARLAACVNILPGVESHYWWQGKLESAAEVMLFIKSSAEQFEALSVLVRAQHSYDCPEIVAIEPGEIVPAYREWWEKEGKTE
jgi:periplasmic divalent cation tolerance protein